MKDSQSEAIERVLSFRYVKMEKAGPKEVRSLAAPLPVVRKAISSNLDSGFYETAEFLAALMCETSVEAVKEEKLVPITELASRGIEFDSDAPMDQIVAQTPFDFTSRNIQFLDQVSRIRDVLSAAVLVDELREGRGSVSERIMRWDALVDKPSALFGPAAPMTRPGAEWLMFRGIPSFPLVGGSRTAKMPGLHGRRKGGEFSWILWEGPLGKDEIKTCLGLNWPSRTPEQRSAVGVCAGFSVALRKDATGYDGTVSPSRDIGTGSGLEWMTDSTELNEIG